MRQALSLLGPVARVRLTALVLGIVAFLSVAIAQRDVGVARDEVIYIDNGTRYARWWTDLVTFEDGTASENRITKTFGGPRVTDGNREHPPLMKTLFGLSRLLFHDRLGWTSELTAARLPTALMNALTVVMVFLFATSVWGGGAGLVAALLTLLLPRAFFHAGLATFDAPMVTLWLATLFAYYRALASRWWCLVLAVAFGLALATKHNALMLPGVIGLHYAWLAVRRARAAGGTVADRVRAFGRALWRLQPLVVPALVVGSPLVLVAVWPWLWFDTAQHVRDWIVFHTNHVHYNFEYLGENYNHPPFPWHVVLVTTLFTVPVATLCASVIGGVYLAARALRAPAPGPADRAPTALIALSALVAMGVFFLPSTPIFGAEKHWAPAIPTLCILAGVGTIASIDRLFRRLADWGWLSAPQTRYVRRGTRVAVAALVVTAALAETVVSHPHGLSHYNALAGGAAGGADLGMNRQFWGVAARQALPFINQFAPAPGEPDVPVYSHDASPAWRLYRSLGLLAPGMPDAGNEVAGIRRSKIAIVVHERHFLRHDLLIWAAYGTTQPAHVVTVDGVPLVSVYVRPELLAGATSSRDRPGRSTPGAPAPGR